MNLNEYWNVGLNASINEVMQLLTTVGVIGIVVFGMVI